jgi:hypothetical protein
VIEYILYFYFRIYFTDHNNDKSNEMIAYRVDALHESDTNGNHDSDVFAATVEQ